MRILLLTLILLTSGCETLQPTPVSKMTIQEVCENYYVNKKNKSLGKVGMIFGAYYNPSFSEELYKRNFFTEDELSLIEFEKIQIGMRKEVLPCLFGNPDAINKTVSSYGTNEQWVYRSVGWYIYVEDGVITSWQN